jgi:thiamine-monophosphate kinase
MSADLPEDNPSLDEFAAIARYFKPLAGDDPTARHLDDDAAVLTPPEGMDLVFTKDAMVAGVHFFEDDPKDLVARKLARVNLSDLASMGAKPLGYLLATALPEDSRVEWLEGLSRGFAADQEIFGWSLWGGDTVSTPGPATLSLTAVGAVARGQALPRGGAGDGDLVFVSGTVGDGGLGLRARTGNLPKGTAADSIKALESRFLLPTPRMTLGQALVGIATSAIDISDGLMSDLGHICEVSGLGAVVRQSALPISDAARAVLELDPSFWPSIFAGDDYELLFTAPPARRDAVFEAAGTAGVPVAEIGRMEGGSHPYLVDEAGNMVKGSLAGYRHF